MKKMDKVADEDREERKKIYVIRLRRDRLLSIGRFITSVPFENFSRIYPTFGSADLTIPTFTTLSPSYSKLFQRVFNFADRWRFVRVIDILQSIYAVFGNLFLYRIRWICSEILNVQVRCSSVCSSFTEYGIYNFVVIYDLYKTYSKDTDRK